MEESLKLGLGHTTGVPLALWEGGEEGGGGGGGGGGKNAQIVQNH